jgi:hypothetical protein
MLPRIHSVTLVLGLLFTSQYSFEECDFLGFDAVWLRSVFQLLVTINFPNLLILVILMMEAIHLFEMSALIRVTWCHIPEDCILHSHCRENIKSYTALTGWPL